MKNQLKRLFGDTIIYGLSGVISSLISIFLIPLYTRVFQPADYGVIALLTTTSVLLNILLIFSLDNSASVLFWDKEDEKERKITFNSWFWFLIFVGLAASLIIIASSKLLSLLFFSSDRYTLLFVLLGGNLFFVGFQKVLNIWCRMLQRPVQAMLFSLAILLLTVVFNVLFILVWKVGVMGVFLSQLIASAVGFLIMVITFQRWISFKHFSGLRLREMIKLSASLVPATVLYWLMNTASVYFLKMHGKDNAEIGLYQVGASVANVLSLATWAFFQAWSPFALSVSKQTNAKDIYRFVFELYCVGGFFIAFSLMLMGRDILTFFTHPDYLGASTVLGLLAINVILLGTPSILAIANNLVKQNTPYAIAISLGSAITVILFLLLIPGYGKEGAAVSMIIGNLAVPLYLVFKTQKLYHVPYNFVRIILVVMIQLIFFIAAYRLTESPVTRSAFVILMGLLIVSLYYFRNSGIFIHALFKKRNGK